MCLIDTTNLWNCTGAMNTVLTKHIPLTGVLIVVVESTVYLICQYKMPHICSIKFRSGD